MLEFFSIFDKWPTAKFVLTMRFLNSVKHLIHRKCTTASVGVLSRLGSPPLEARKRLPQKAVKARAVLGNRFRANAGHPSRSFKQQCEVTN